MKKKKENNCILKAQEHNGAEGEWSGSSHHWEFSKNGRMSVADERKPGRKTMRLIRKEYLRKNASRVILAWTVEEVLFTCWLHAEATRRRSSGGGIYRKTRLWFKGCFVPPDSSSSPSGGKFVRLQRRLMLFKRHMGMRCIDLLC